MRNAWILTLLLCSALPAAGPIDRQALVNRHNVAVRSADQWAPLSVGNGEFAFTADITGLQTFPDHYKTSIPLAIQSQWGWHSIPNSQGYRLQDTFQKFDTDGRPVEYPTNANGPAGRWLRENPHRLNLARIGFDFASGEVPVRIEDIKSIDQRLNLWTGTIESTFTVAGETVRVRTTAHPDLDMIAVRVEKSGPRPLGIKIEFPYGSEAHSGDGANWGEPGKHSSVVTASAARLVEWQRQLDQDRYSVRVEWTNGGALEKRTEHSSVLRFAGTSFEFAASFKRGPHGGKLPSVAATEAAARRYWKRFWTTGGAMDLTGSTDPRAAELERRIVLSQYLTAIQCSGTMPPQETGLTYNSWFGKFHLEMHWWHAAHFALWNRPALLERSLPWYRTILPEARNTASRQGYEGVRWPKMTAPDGKESPSGIGPLLIWQQPHLIHLLELLFRARPAREVLTKYQDLVFPTAEFMASYPVWDETGRRYVLGPPVIPAQELHPARTTRNPTFELEYWRWGLETAQRWRERLGLKREAKWDRVVRGLASLPQADGVYVNAESDPNTFTDAAKRRDHPSLLGAKGILPGASADNETMRRTLRKVMDTWQWDSTWGWDYPMTAMAAARVGEPEIAIDALLMNSPKNRYLPNGHNYQRPGLTIYLPGNGGLLTAVAMMAAGWDGAPAQQSPGFPKNGKWVVRWENLRLFP